MNALNDLQVYHEIQQFYFSEARLLDERRYQSWMKLLAPDVEYLMPNRSNCSLDVDLKNMEELLNLEQELSQGLEPPLRDDNMITLSLRANRPTNPVAWADNPMPRTRRHVSNVEVYQEKKKNFQVYNNVLMTYSRHARDNHVYSFQRQDQLQRVDGDLKIARRKIVIDWNVITAPTMALIL